MWSFYLHLLRMCNHLKDADAGFQVVSDEFGLVVFVGVCIASSSYYMQVPRIFQNPLPTPFVVSCSGACVKKIYFYSNFDCLKSASSIYPCHFFFLLFFVTFAMLCKFLQLILISSFKRHGCS